jgi:dihydrodipicolinate synthase/N-acetylneuraminate lyase
MEPMTKLKGILPPITTPFENGDVALGRLTQLPQFRRF